MEIHTDSLELLRRNTPPDEVKNKTPLLSNADRYKIKKKLILKRLENIKIRYKNYHKKYKKFKRYNTFINLVIASLNACSITFLSVGLTSFPPLAIVSLGTTSVSSILQGSTSVLNLQNKINLCYTAYLQLLDLYGDYQSKILKNNLSSDDLNNMLDNINDKLGLILDAVAEISVNSIDNN